MANKENFPKSFLAPLRRALGKVVSSSQFTCGLALLTTCAVSVYATNKLTTWQAREYCNAIGFDHFAPAFNDFIANQSMKDGEVLEGSQIPKEISDFGIRKIYRKGQFIFFLMTFTSILADDAEEGIFYDLDRRDGSATIKEIINTQKKQIRHIQILPNQRGGWFYWKYL